MTKEEKKPKHKRKNLYDDINISERSINIFIVVIVMLLLIALYFGLRK
ncbi:hypothetical protein NHG25_02310 [Aerococcaceae bacterium NML191292]|nr:hypothetical protein [Aerococcaceae bacterium NML210727]MCW6653985.1 hypothetical protein [Aerococcaceae bacterium NML201296]MCW6659305.1 hypothetical protein [Aerococcaceae bacterium NML191292]MCW6660880.1 hypothetical protein [Aerococcaceae bacterium NML201209]MCW6662985.1 hypothetical protein [Aerococcaceae bacterium NML190073]MCW6664901.1 hypothetical protein [Aerococcaceae bacterium NML191219]MCW6666510.1 hypothetical protein [Aerococcaceae bacterium NML190938]MCW6674785.1 hypothetic